MQLTPPVKARTRYFYIDVFRVIAATLVMLYHFTTRYSEVIGRENAYPVNIPWGYAGWAIFFIITGFLVNPLKARIANPLRFFADKYLRLYPGFLLASVVVAPCAAVFLPELAVNLKEWLVNLTMFGGVLGFKSVVGVDWTITIDLFWYAFVAVAAVLLLFIDRKQKLTPTAKVALCMAVGIGALAVRQGYAVTSNRVIKLVSIVTMGDYFHLFMIGILLAYLRNGGSRALTAVGLLVQNGIHIFIYRNSPIFCAIVFVFTVIFTLCILLDPKEGKPALWKKVIIVGADISFVFYLTHEYIGWGIMRIMDKVGMTSEIFLLIPIAICIALAYVLHYGIEKRILSKLPKLSGGKAGK